MINIDFNAKIIKYSRLPVRETSESPYGKYIPKDFIHCPICKFHSEKKQNISESWEYRNIKELENADANGAYNIARKWIIVLNKIKEK